MPLSHDLGLIPPGASETQLSDIVDTAKHLKASLEKDVHDVPFSNLNERVGPLANGDAPTSKTGGLIQRIFAERGCHKSIIESYNHFLLYSIPHRIKHTAFMVNKGVLDVEIRLSNVSIYKPTESRYRPVPLLPVKARLERGSYMAKIHADIEQWYKGELVRTERGEIAEVPVMLGSVACHTYGMTDGEKLQIGECPNDTQAYFIHNGIERVCKAKETIRYNTPVTYRESMGYETRFTHTSSNGVGTTLFLMRYLMDGKDDHNMFMLKLQHFDDKFVDVFSIFRLLGWSVERSVEVIVGFCDISSKNKLKIEQLLRDTTAFSKNIPDNLLASFIAPVRKIKPDTEQQVVNDIRLDLFSNVDDVDSKLYTLAFTTAHTAMIVLRFIAEDDRNSWSVKKFQVASDSVASQFKIAMNNMVKKVEESINKSEYAPGDPIAHIITAHDFRSKVLEIFSAKVKGMTRGSDKQSLSEQYKRNTQIDGVSFVTKSSAYTSTQNKNNDVRVINLSQYLVICTAETPESEKIGITKNMAFTMWIALSVLGLNREQVESVLGTLDNEPWFVKAKDVDENRNADDTNESAKSAGYKNYPLFINGKLIGFLPSSQREHIKKLKSSGMLRFDACVHFNRLTRVVEIFTTESRPTVPLLIVKYGTLIIDEKDMWDSPINELISEGCIEYVDAREMEYLTVAEHVGEARKPENRYKYTHSTIQANAMFGIAGALSPYANKNKGPRVIFQARLVKQSQSPFSLTHNLVYISGFKILNYAVRPICESNISGAIGMKIMPNSQNFVIAIITCPNNNEDAVVINKDVLNKQQMRISKYTGVNVTAENNKIISEIFVKPVTERNSHIYRHLDEDGFPKIGSYIERKDALIGKYRSENKGEITFDANSGEYVTKLDTKPRNSSKFAGVDEDGILYSVYASRASNGDTTARIKIHQYRQYEAGDKVSLRYSQKGTIGEVAESSQLPRIIGGPHHGVIPDILFSSASLPSRMTGALPVEFTKGQAFIYNNRISDCTSFEDDDIDEPARELEVVGRERYGMKGAELERFSNGLFHMERPDGKIMGKHMKNEETGNIDFIPSEVFIGVAAYQMLRHHVRDKFQLRLEGAINILTRQGVSGRSRQGGLRYGNMECDATISSGASHTLIERMRTTSDEYTRLLCTCGADALVNPQTKVKTCTANANHGKEGDRHEFRKNTTCYISLLLTRLLAIASIKMDTIPER